MLYWSVTLRVSTVLLLPRPASYTVVNITVYYINSMLKQFDIAGEHSIKVYELYLKWKCCLDLEKYNNKYQILLRIDFIYTCTSCKHTCVHPSTHAHTHTHPLADAHTHTLSQAHTDAHLPIFIPIHLSIHTYIE